MASSSRAPSVNSVTTVVKELNALNPELTQQLLAIAQHMRDSGSLLVPDSTFFPAVLPPLPSTDGTPPPVALPPPPIVALPSSSTAHALLVTIHADMLTAEANNISAQSALLAPYRALSAAIAERDRLLVAHDQTLTANGGDVTHPDVVVASQAVSTANLALPALHTTVQSAEASAGAALATHSVASTLFTAKAAEFASLYGTSFQTFVPPSASPPGPSSPKRPLSPVSTAAAALSAATAAVVAAEDSVSRSQAALQSALSASPPLPDSEVAGFARAARAATLQLDSDKALFHKATLDDDAAKRARLSDSVSPTVSPTVLRFYFLSHVFRIHSEPRIIFTLPLLRPVWFVYFPPHVFRTHSEPRVLFSTACLPYPFGAA